MLKTKSYPWLMLFSRIALFFLAQALFALVFLIMRKAPAWGNGANWWPLSVALADLACLIMLTRIFRAEGNSFWKIFRIDRHHLWGDLLALLGLTVLTAPLTYFPNVLLANLLFGDSAVVTDLFYRPLPYGAVYLAMIAFPIAQGLTEVPTYFGYVMPRFEAYGMNKWLAISLPSLMLAFQHLAMPFLLDGRFILWRGLMFLPFAFLVGFAFHWRPRLLPYFIVVHILMNMATMTVFLSVAY